jgi:hypothetical protein
VECTCDDCQAIRDLADDHEEACYEDEGESAYGRDE